MKQFMIAIGAAALALPAAHADIIAVANCIEADIDGDGVPETACNGFVQIPDINQFFPQVNENLFPPLPFPPTFELIDPPLLASDPHPSPGVIASPGLADLGWDVELSMPGLSPLADQLNVFDDPTIPNLRFTFIAPSGVAGAVTGPALLAEFTFEAPFDVVGLEQRFIGQAYVDSPNGPIVAPNEGTFTYLPNPGSIPLLALAGVAATRRRR